MLLFGTGLIECECKKKWTEITLDVEECFFNKLDVKLTESQASSFLSENYIIEQKHDWGGMCETGKFVIFNPTL